MGWVFWLLDYFALVLVVLYFLIFLRQPIALSFVHVDSVRLVSSAMQAGVGGMFNNTLREQGVVLADS